MIDHNEFYENTNTSVESEMEFHREAIPQPRYTPAYMTQDIPKKKKKKKSGLPF